MSVTAGESTPKIKLLSAWFCPYAQRAWIALEEKCSGNFTVVESMNKKSHTPYVVEKTSLLFQKNPKACVPVILDGRGDDAEDVVVYESLICVEYVDEAMGNDNDDGPRLLPGPPSQRAHARMWAVKYVRLFTICCVYRTRKARKRLLKIFSAVCVHLVNTASSLRQGRGKAANLSQRILL